VPLTVASAGGRKRLRNFVITARRLPAATAVCHRLARRPKHSS
jgi:hypothetical protein